MMEIVTWNSRWQSLFFIGGKNMRHIGEKIILVLCIAVFGIALSSCWKNKVFAVIATFGRKYSLIFYIIHPLFSRIEYKIFDMNSLQQYLGYIFVVLGSLTFSILYVTMKEKRGIKRS